jgi:Domain of unknown function (DUF4340)
MKNKHLLLIFGCTLFLGLLARYSPWFKNEIFNTDLVRIDSSKIERISILLPGQSELLLEHSDEGWVASQDDLALRTDDSLLTPILEALSVIRSRRIVDGAQRDTLGLLPSEAVHVEVYLKNGAKERFEIGKETWDNKLAATYVEIDKHDGIYLTDKHLRKVFARKINDFRSKVLLDFSPDSLSAFKIFLLNADTLHFQKRDTAGLWQSNKVATFVSAEPVQLWLQALQKLRDLPFATQAEERLSADDWLATLELSVSGAEEPIALHFFALGVARPSSKQLGVKYLLQSSQNPFSYFVLSDSFVVRRILEGPVPTASD